MVVPRHKCRVGYSFSSEFLETKEGQENTAYTTAQGQTKIGSHKKDCAILTTR
eukprot:COSAG01_NODE_64953_length_274_cov_8.960000_1_plen_52_part_10